MDTRALQEKRHTKIKNSIKVAEAKLRRTANRLSHLRAQDAYYTRVLSRPVKVEVFNEPAPAPQAAPAPVVAPLPPAILAEAKATADCPDIPAFLRRTLSEPDVKAIAEIEAHKAAKAEISKARSKVRAQHRKAKENGDTRRMPLTGTDALAAIRGEPVKGEIVRPKKKARR